MRESQNTALSSFWVVLGKKKHQNILRSPQGAVNVVILAMKHSLQSYANNNERVIFHTFAFSILFAQVRLCASCTDQVNSFTFR